MPPFWQERLPYSEHLPMSVWNVICSGLSKSRLASRRAPLVMCCSLTSSRAAKTTSITRSQSITRRKSRSEEHTSELHSPDHLVCRLLLEKKKYASYLAGA